MARRKKQNQEETIVDIVQAREQAQDFFERNQLLVLGAIALVVIGIGGFFAYQNLYKHPRNKTALEQMFQAQLQFERDSFALALDNPGGGYDGFLDIIDKYGGTKAANISHYYAGVSYLHLGRYEAAIDFLGKFKPDGEITPIMKQGTLGDAYSELEMWDKAISHYKRAAEVEENRFLTPYYLKKLGLLYEQQGDNEKALAQYAKIKELYPNTTAGQDIDKYITRAEVK